MTYDQVVKGISGLQALYMMLEANGATALADSSGNGRNMPLTGTSVFSSASTPGTMGGQAFVDNGTVYGGITAPAWWQNLTALTAMAWFKTTATGIMQMWCGDQNIFGPGDGRRKFELYLDSGKLSTVSFTTAGGFPYMSPATKLFNDGQWHCAVTTRAATPGTAAQKLYIDGVLYATQDSSGTWSGTSANLTLACGEPNQVWNGSLGPMALWNRQLSDAEVASLYSGASGPTGPAFTAGMRLFGTSYAAGADASALPARLQRYLLKRGQIAPATALTVRKATKINGSSYAAGAAAPTGLAPTVLRRLLRGKILK